MNMKNNRSQLLYISQAAIIAAVYAALCLVFAPISFAAVQVRIAECLTILPMFTPAAIPGLFIGCIIGNAACGAVLPDVIFGSLATLIGAWLGYRLRDNRWLVPIPTVIANTIIVPLVLKYAYLVDLPLWLSAIYILGGEILSSYILGEILGAALLKHPAYRKEREEN